MSREFIDAIASGNNLEAEDEVKNSISSKVGDVLEFRRKELSQNFAGNNEVDEGIMIVPKAKPKKAAAVAYGGGPQEGIALVPRPPKGKKFSPGAMGGTRAVPIGKAGPMVKAHAAADRGLSKK